MSDKDGLPEISADVRTVVAQSLELAQSAFARYLKLIDSGMSASPWGDTDLTKKIRLYAEQNVASAFAFADKLIQAKNFEEVVKIQTEFVQSQLSALGEQAKDMGGTATKAATKAVKVPIKRAS